jgi:hypothetical protein
MSSRSGSLVALPLLLSLLLASPSPAEAQTVRVEGNSTLKAQSGSVLRLEGGTMDLGDVGSGARLEEDGSSRVAGGELKATRRLNAPDKAEPAGLGAVITAAEDLGDVALRRADEVQTASNGNESVRRYWEISPSKNNSSLSAKLTLEYSEAELNGIAESDLSLFKSEDGGSTWTSVGADARDAGANAVTAQGISSFSRWTLGSEAQPLPVELATFEASLAEGANGTSAKSGGDEAVRLEWRTASETGNAGFEVERQAAGSDPGESFGWEKVGYVESKASGGTTAKPKSYQFTDSDLPFEADSLSYRLRQVDTDGTESASRAVTIGRPATELRLLKTYPNPARTRATVRYVVPDRQNVSIRVYDILGRRVRTVRSGEVEGRKKATIGLSGLSSGAYFLRLQANGQTRAQRLTVVR